MTWSTLDLGVAVVRGGGKRQEARGKVPGSRFVCLFSTIICPSALRKGSSFAAARAVMRFQWTASHHRLPTRHATGRHGLRALLSEPHLPPLASGLLELVDAMPRPDMVPTAIVKDKWGTCATRTALLVPLAQLTAMSCALAAACSSQLADSDAECHTMPCHRRPASSIE
jgi:hypothetical protein